MKDALKMNYLYILVTFEPFVWKESWSLLRFL